MFYSHFAKTIIPKRYHGAILRARNRFTGYRMESYSQQGEDLILRILFSHVDRGFFVDVGAFKPKQFSNTYFFYKRGWRGINIDATPGAVSEFNKTRPRDINVEAAVARDHREMMLFMFNEREVNTLSPNLALMETAQAERPIVDSTIVKTRTLGEILDRHLPTGQKVDFLSVDVEGYDFEVLQSNDWDKHRPDVVLCEDLALDNLEDVERSEVYRFLRDHGYSLFSKCFHTLIFVHKMFRPCV